MKKFFGLALLVVLIGCNPNGGDKFVGKWVHTKFAKATITIEPNGEGLILRNTQPSAWDGRITTENIPASYKDGLLQIANDFGPTNYTIDKASGNLTDGRNEYKRIKE